MKDKIIALVGESGSGKSTIAELLEKEGYNYIQSYTTRPKRYENEKGHIFVNADDYREAKFVDEVFRGGFIIAHTFFDGNDYWATREQYIGHEVSIYIIDPTGIQELLQRVKDAEIVTIYLKTDREERLRRMLLQRDPKTVCNRMKHDREAFKSVFCNYAVDANRNVDEVLKDVKSIIERR